MKYNSNSTYSWKPDETFTLSGREFGFILNTVRSILSTEQAEHILLAARANDILEKMMAENVENGKIFEVTKKENTNDNKEELDKRSSVLHKV